MKIKISFDVVRGYLIFISGNLIFLSFLNLDSIYKEIVVQIFLGALAFPLLRKKNKHLKLYLLST